MDLEVTWIHHWKKNGKSSTLTRPFRARAVQGLSGLALLNVDPEWRRGNTFKASLTTKKKYLPVTAAAQRERGKKPMEGVFSHTNTV